MRHIFIINPVSGKGNARVYIDIIEKIFSDRIDDYEIIQTEYPGHATEICKKRAGGKDVRFYSIGGDGTLTEVINGIGDSLAPVGIIPAGSGNDYIRSVYENISSDPYELISQLVDGDIKPVKTGYIDDTEFINVASIGFDAYVVECAKSFKKVQLINGSVAYILGIFKALLTFKKKSLKLILDGESIDTDVFLVAFGMGKYYGGGMKVLPDACNQWKDKWIDVCLVHNVSKLKVLFLFPKLISGEHIGEKYSKIVTYKKVKNLQICGDSPLLLNKDGELLPWKNELKCSVNKDRLNIIVPRLT